ncbi:MAG: hypothetical protein H7069_01235 [Phormidesmis sp. FL-bin-119]|nr:hypothetical protein [Pedobacter sp.]
MIDNGEDKRLSLLDGNYELSEIQSDTGKPASQHFEGKVFIIINAANSSVTFNFIDKVNEHNLATLIGQKTGGNMQGINANSFVFLSLPNSQFRIDIPLVFNDPGYPRKEGGINPDYIVPDSQKDIENGVDTQTEFVYRLILTK